MTSTDPQISDRSLKLRLLIAGLVGILFSIILHIFANPNPYRQSVLVQRFAANLSTFAALIARFFKWIGTFPGALIPFAFFVLFVALSPRHKNAWISAFMTGVMLSNILLHWL